MKLAAQKMTVPGPLKILLDGQRQDEFKAQIETQLKPVQRDVDFRKFNFDEGWAHVSKVAENVKPYLRE